LKIPSGVPQLKTSRLKAALPLFKGEELLAQLGWYRGFPVPIWDGDFHILTKEVKE